MIAPRVFRLPVLLCCDSCGEEWFGPNGEKQGRAHAAHTGHQVHMQFILRETLNMVAERVEPYPAAGASRSPASLAMSREAATARLVALYGGGD